MKAPRLLSTVAAVLATAGALVAAPSSAVAATPDQHVIVRSSAGTAALRALVAHVGGKVDRPLALIHGVVATVPASAVETLRASSGVIDVTADSAVSLAETSGSALAAPYVASADPYSLYNLENATGVRSVWARPATPAVASTSRSSTPASRRSPGLTAGQRRARPRPDRGVAGPGHGAGRHASATARTWPASSPDTTAASPTSAGGRSTRTTSWAWHRTPASSASRSPTRTASATSRRSSPASTGSSSTRTTTA